MKRFFMVLVLAAAVMAVAGCGTLQLNHIVTGTECPTKEDCIKDLGLDKQPESPDIVFVVEPLLMDEKSKAPVGTPAFNSPTYHGNVELCVAKALKFEFVNAKVVFDDKDAKMPFVRVKLNKIVSQGVFPASLYMRIDYELIINGKSHTSYSKTDSEVFWNNERSAKKQYPLVCEILAKQVKETLEKEKIAAPASPATTKAER
ncbi:MAG: hypothetical protein M1610_03795 [Nitrospirae bacterium]|nr:hypothetical protein [Nitrospirota bacterium]